MVNHKLILTNRNYILTYFRYLKEKDICMDYFSSWTEQDQIEFVEELLKSMQHHQHGTVNAFLKPMLQRDFISLLPKKGLDHVAEKIIGRNTQSIHYRVTHVVDENLPLT